MAYVNSYKYILFTVACMNAIAYSEQEQAVKKQILFEVLSMDVALNEQSAQSLSDLLGDRHHSTRSENEHRSLLGFVSGDQDAKNAAWKFFSALSTDEATDLWSNAVLQAEHNIPVKLRSTTTRNVPVSAQGTIDPVITFSRQGLSLNLNITPSVHDDNTIGLDINFVCENQDLDNSYHRNFSSKVTVNNGDIVVLGESYADVSLQDLLTHKKCFVVLRVSIVEEASQIENTSHQN